MGVDDNGVVQYIYPIHLAILDGGQLGFHVKDSCAILDLKLRL